MIWRIRYNPVGRYYTVPLRSSLSRPRTPGYHRLLRPTCDLSGARRAPRLLHSGRSDGVHVALGSEGATSNVHLRGDPASSECRRSGESRVRDRCLRPTAGPRVVVRQDVRSLAVAVRLPRERDLLQGTRTGPGGDSSCHWCLLVSAFGTSLPYG